MEDIRNGARDPESTMNPIARNSTGPGWRDMPVPNISGASSSSRIDESYIWVRCTTTKRSPLRSLVSGNRKTARVCKLRLTSMLE